MAYSEKAKALRQCKALRKDGKPCQAYAVWGEDFCMAHSGRHHRGPMPHPYERRFKKRPRRSPTCHCPAYNWPHRPGGGMPVARPTNQALYNTGRHARLAATPQILELRHYKTAGK